MTYSDLKNQIIQSGRSYDMDAIDRAYALAEKSHSGQMRESGEPYIVHPLAVASLLVDLGMDTESVCAALLHDVVEDTDTTLEDIRKQFGEDVAQLVDGVTKLGKIPFSTVEEQQAENLRKLLMAMSKDIRVMIIKLCDRLHNMRTIEAKAEDRRRANAYETMEVYAPIAHRLGMSGIKEELQDRSLAQLDPVGYREAQKVLESSGKGAGFINGVVHDIKERLEQNGITDVQIENRIKSVYSTYRKLFIQNRSVEEIYDIFAIRVIVGTVAECYNVLGVLHDMYRPIPNRFKDYISTPKENGYRSLHTTLIGRDGVPFEVQIRTHEMHIEAEYGIAAHWKYKAGISGKDDLDGRLAWLRQLLESQKDSDDSLDIISDLKRDILPEQVFVFTPKGDVIELPTGATVIDFAYAIHTAVGNRMVGAKVDGRIVPLSYCVKTGEICEIITGAKDKGPSRDWLNIVKTSEARSKIKSWFKKKNRDENIAEGKLAFERDLRRSMINIPADKYDAFVDEIVRRQKLNSADEMFAAIGYGGLLMSRIMPKVKEEYLKLQKTEGPQPEPVVETTTHNHKAQGGVIVEGLDNCLVKFAHCCNPLPGDDIVGFITRGGGVSIHKSGCPNAAAAKKLDGDDAPRWVKVEWADKQAGNFKSTIEIEGSDRVGLIADISSQISSLHVPIYGFNSSLRGDVFVITVVIAVNNTEHLESVITRLRKIKNVQSVRRITA